MSDAAAGLPAAGHAARVSTTDLWKALALLLITLDHYGLFLDPAQDWWRVAGRASLPIWFFFVGFARSRTVPWTWLAIGIGLTLLDLWYEDLDPAEAPLNIVLGFALIRLALPWIEERIWPSRWRIAALLAVLTLLLPVGGFIVEYGTEGWLLALVGLAHRRWLEAPDGETLWRRAAIAIYAGGAFCAVEIADFSFDPPQAAALIGLVAAVSALLVGFRRDDVQWQPPVPVAAFLRLCGRRSLMLYAAQIVILTLAAVMLGIDADAGDSMTDDTP